MADPMRNAGAPPFISPSFLQNAFKSNTFRLDEGYADDTRSQAGSEMHADSRMGDAMEQDSSSLPPWVSNLDEAERSGKSTLSYKRRKNISVAQSLFRCYCRSRCP